MRIILKNTSKTKEYLDSLPKIYGIFLWAKWGMLELPWTGKYDKDGFPLVYIYYDCNGCCDEYYLGAIHRASSGGFYNWYTDEATAKEVQETLNKELEAKLSRD